MTTAVRTRYAPSPTGAPHVGNIRTALFAWALARANGGQFLLRIEDTDQKRLAANSIPGIYESLAWLGIHWDEGPDIGGPHAPYIQSQRLDIYNDVAATLIAQGTAYRCFCSAERLDQLRAAQRAAKKPPGYDGLCGAISPRDSEVRGATEPHVVRFRMKAAGTTVLDDAVRGRITFDNALQDDFVVVKSDGFPTYHLAAIVDDHIMEISHVLRGEEWLSSAPKHLQLAEALGYRVPVYAHLPLIVGPDHKKLAKRTGDTAALDYRDRGYLPEAMVNFLALLGWSLDAETTLIPPAELAAKFTLERVVPNPAVFDLGRLDYLNGQYIRAMPEPGWRRTIADWCDSRLPDTIPRPIDRELVAEVAPLLRERVNVLGDIPAMVQFLFGFEAPEYTRETLVERLDDPQRAPDVLHAALLGLDAIAPADWGAATVEAAIRAMEATLEMKLRKFVAVLYVAVMGRASGIPLFDSLAILGRERTLARLRTARSRLD
ncbi:MAG: glutamate--tRNA ligase [Dehalococcoidia bacterium]